MAPDHYADLARLIDHSADSARLREHASHMSIKCNLMAITCWSRDTYKSKVATIVQCPAKGLEFKECSMVTQLLKSRSVYTKM